MYLALATTALRAGLTAASIIGAWELVRDFRKLKKGSRSKAKPKAKNERA